MKNNFVWFALTYWVYLSTKSVISTSLVGGTFLVAGSCFQRLAGIIGRQAP